MVVKTRIEWTGNIQVHHPIICESPESCACVCHKLGYISHGNCCEGR